MYEIIIMSLTKKCWELVFTFQWLLIIVEQEQQEPGKF